MGMDSNCVLEHCLLANSPALESYPLVSLREADGCQFVFKFGPQTALAPMTWSVLFMTWVMLSWFAVKSL